MTETYGPKQAAEVLGVTVKTLRNWRCSGKGPPYMKRGHKTVIYPVDSLLEWMDDEYELRNVRSNQWAAEIVKAGYRSLARKHHPDLAGDTETMKQINQAAEDLRGALGSG